MDTEMHAPSETKKKSLNLEDWVTIVKRRKWKWAREIATVQEDIWTKLAYNWDPSPQFSLKAKRRSGRQKRKQDDDIVEYHMKREAGHEENQRCNREELIKEWMEVAKDEEQWAKLENGVVQ